MALVQLLSVKVLVANLGVDQYAVFSLLIGLTGWYALSEFNIGVSTQNYLSEERANGTRGDDYLVAAGVLAIAFLLLTVAVLKLISPYLGPLFLKNFDFLNEQGKVRIFFTVGLMLIAANVGSIAYKVWYAEMKGYFSNIVPAIAAILSLFGIVLVGKLSNVDKLYWSVFAYVFPTALLPVFALSSQVFGAIRRGGKVGANILARILKRAAGFWGFALMAAAVLQIDYVIMSQYLKADQIVVYNISTKVFGLVFFIYQALLAALWPVISEAVVRNEWSAIRTRMKRTISVGVVFMGISTVALIWLMPIAFSIIAPTDHLFVPTSLILLMGFYFVVRIWTDSFAMLLQSMSDLRPFWLIVPAQAVISITGQLVLVPMFGLYGVFIGLCVAFLLTVSWALPVASKRHFKDALN